ncbi:hypothetical protein [Psychromicrobium sp. YIM B11713]|uniref:hypothetical protein n=1 Tax=Psychromicrobium sp. YIM B11713 TaxID=3145233 RepID=UPI00374EA064
MHNDSHGEGFFPPLDYAAFWWVLGVLLLLLIGVWYFSACYATRAKPQTGAIPMPPKRVPALRAEYLARIDQLVFRHHAGELSARDAHQKLSLLVRGFVQELTGVRTERMTLAELRTAGLPMVGDVVEVFYPAEFGVQDAESLGHSADAARQLVGTWS